MRNIFGRIAGITLLLCSTTFAAHPSYSFNGLDEEQVLAVCRSSDRNVRLSAYHYLRLQLAGVLRELPPSLPEAGEPSATTKILAKLISDMKDDADFDGCVKSLVFSVRNKAGVSFIEDTLKDQLTHRDKPGEKASLTVGLRDLHYIQGLAAPDYVLASFKELIKNRDTDSGLIVYEVKQMRVDAASLTDVILQRFREAHGDEQQRIGGAYHELKKPISPKERREAVPLGPFFNT